MRAALFLKIPLITVLIGLILVNASVLRVQAQLASLTADTVTLSSDTKTLLASGNVQVFFNGAVLRADQIIYDQKADKIRIDGEFEIQRGAHLTVHAQNATLDGDLENALINGAKALIEDKLRIEAQQTQIEPQQTRFEDVLVSTCDICETQPTPLWQIRTKRVYHRPQKQRIYFESAVLEFGRLPILIAPRLSIPEPGIARATGLLPPIFNTSDKLGFGFKTPIYYKINAHSDATIAPFLTSQSALILEGEYRRRTQRGGYILQGAFAPRDPYNLNGISAYMKADARFRLWQDYDLDLDINLSSKNASATDPANESFIEKYEYSDQDRLLNSAVLSKTKTKSYFEIGSTAIQSLRATEPDSNIPVVLPVIFAHLNSGDQLKHGRFELQAQGISLQRASSGAHYTLAGKASWNKSWHKNNGMIFGVGIRSDAASYFAPSNTGSSFLPSASAKLNYPLQRQNGAISHILEPIIQVIIAPDRPFGAFNSDATTLDGVTVEFEETNLFSENRFAGFDTTELGSRANIGLKYKRLNPNGWNYGLTLGRVLRNKDLNQFDAIDAPGLSDKHSDLVSALTLNYSDILALRSRLLFDDTFDFSKSETNVKAKLDKFDLTMSYVNLDIDPIEKQREISVQGTYYSNKNVSISAKIRHNLLSKQPIEQALALKYQNECAKIEFRLGRTFDSLGTPNRSIGMRLELDSFGGQSGQRKFNRQCRDN